MREEFEIEVDVFVSKKKKFVHVSLMKALVSYKFLNEIIVYEKVLVSQREILFWLFFYRNLNQSLKWGFIILLLVTVDID